MLYEVIIGNYLDDTLRSIFVLSNEPINENYLSLDAMIGIDKEFEYVGYVKTPKIVINAWTEDEWDELNEVKKLISKP